MAMHRKFFCLSKRGAYWYAHLADHQTGTILIAKKADQTNRYERFFTTFLMEFNDYDKSPYAGEKLAHGHYN